jgi:hypothetical protein
MLLRKDKLPKYMKLDPRILHYMIEDNADRHISVRELTGYVNSQDYGVKLKKSSIHNYLVNKLNYRYKKQVQLHLNADTRASYVLRNIFLKKLTKYLEDDYIIVYIDESGFNLENKSFKTWVQSDSNNIIFRPSRQKNISLIVGVTKNEILLFRIVEGGFNGVKFLDYFADLYKKAKHTYGNKVVFYLDNAPIHHCRVFKEYVWLNTVKVIYGVPYMCLYNLSEYVFCQIKNKVYSELFMNK